MQCKISKNCFFPQSFRHAKRLNENNKRYQRQKIVAQCHIVYSVVIIIIQSIYIANSGNSHEYNLDTKTGCNIKDIWELKGLSIGCLVLAITLILLSMCIQTLKPEATCGANDTEYRGIPYYAIFLAYCIMLMLCGVMFSRGDAVVGEASAMFDYTDGDETIYRSHSIISPQSLWRGLGI